MTIQKFLTFGVPDVGQHEANAIAKAIASGWLGYGPRCQEFEKKFGNLIGAEHCVAVNSCTTGLILALKAAGIKRGDKVLTIPITFAATVNAILEVGATPVFVDIGSETEVDPDIDFYIPVHLWGERGYGPDVAEGFKVIEDCAHGFGGHYQGKSFGTFGNFGVFSFYPTKNITTGDGGMVVCKTKEDEETVRILASQGLTKGAWNRYSDAPLANYEVALAGNKGLMNDIAASMGLAQLERWPEIKAKRNTIFKIYEQAFGAKEEGHSQHIYEIRAKNREELRAKLYNEGIGTGIHYNPLHLEPAYRFLGYKEGDFPNAEKIGRETLSLPLSSVMTEDDAIRVVDAVKKHGVLNGI